MRRLVLFCLAALAATASAQAPSELIGPGTRVRVFFPPESLPPSGLVFTGTLVSVRDTLVIDTDEGNTIRVAPRDIAGFDVSAGRGPFPYWLPVVTGVVGGTMAYTLIPENTSTDCILCPDKPSFRDVYTGLGTLAGLGAGLLIGRSLAAERWVPASRMSLTTNGATLSVRL